MKHLKIFENVDNKKNKFKKDISDFDLDDLLYDTVLKLNVDIIELLLVLGANVKPDYLYSSVCSPLESEKRIYLAELFVKHGCDPNKKIYVNGIYQSVTCLTMLCSTKQWKNYNVISKVVELGGDLLIKDNFKKCAFDYLLSSDLEILKNKIPNFDELYDEYKIQKDSEKYNL